MLPTHCKEAHDGRLELLDANLQKKMCLGSYAVLYVPWDCFVHSIIEYPAER